MFSSNHSVVWRLVTEIAYNTMCLALLESGIPIKTPQSKLQAGDNGGKWLPISLHFPNAVVLNAVGRRNMQKKAKERK